MTIKSTVSFTQRHHDFAKSLVEEGVYASVSSVVAAGIERVMQDKEERAMVLEGMKEAVNRRMNTPREEWVEVKEGDDLFEKARTRIHRADPG